jgi:hypothetical protein
MQQQSADSTIVQVSHRQWLYARHINMLHLLCAHLVLQSFMGVQGDELVAVGTTITRLSSAIVDVKVSASKAAACTSHLNVVPVIDYA